jgi:predicted MFS family arabinose efflux permease
MQQVLGYTPSATGLAWLATTVTAFVAAMAGGRLVGRMHTRWLLITGLMAVTAGTLWLARIPADAGYLDGLLPAFLVVGIGFGFCGPALQIGALSGVAASDTGLASGLVETMREIGGASGVAIVATALVGGTGLSGFHTGLVITAVIALLGVIAAAAGFARSDHERRANA